MSGDIVKVENTTGVLEYEYDKGGLLIKQTDTTSGEVVVYTYDKAGRKKRMESNSREVSYEYGRNSELLKVSDNKQRLYVTYKYDAVGRETERTTGGGSTQYTYYDSIGRIEYIKETNSQGYIIRAEGYIYDNMGRRIANINEKAEITRYEYNSQGQLSRVYYPQSQELLNKQEEEALANKAR